ncbi:MAG: hypothetical protein ACE5KP_05665 [Dehalococcoidales bacterium]
MIKWRRYLKFGLIVTLLVVLVLIAIGCEDFGQFPPPETPKEEPEKPAPTTFINSEDRAVLAVYEHLLSLAESHEAKTYLAEFSAASDNWSAKSELFKDGTSIWYVQVDMTGVAVWEEKPYWQQAGWFVYQDGRVIPSNRLQANALRIEADLQELSLQPVP